MEIHKLENLQVTRNKLNELDEDEAFDSPMTIQMARVDGHTSYVVALDGTENPNFRCIMEAWLDSLEMHERKARDYAARDEGFNLGLRGEFVGISRKVQKLKRIVWDGKDPLFEGAQEILMDLMGQVGLALMEQKRVKDKYFSQWRDNHRNKPTFG